MSDNSAIIRCDICRQLNRVPLEKIVGKPLCGNCKSVLDIPKEPVWLKRGTFDRMVSTWPETLLVEFTAPASVFCKIVDPIVNNLAREKAGKLKVIKVDIEADTYMAERFKIDKTPTFIVFKNSAEIMRVDGAPKEKTDLVKWIENIINLKSF
jgi:thioredoxin 2